MRKTRLREVKELSWYVLTNGGKDEILTRKGARDTSGEGSKNRMVLVGGRFC